MSEQDRGAYTPQREAPLQFDPRRARDARPMPMTLIGSAVVLVVLIGAVAMAYLGGFRHKAASSDNAVGDRVIQMKTAPAAGQEGPSEPGAKLEVFTGKPTTTQPVFAAEPEQPKPRASLQLRASTLPPVRLEPAQPVAGAAPSGPPPAAVKAPVSSVAATDLSTAHTSITTRTTVAKTVATEGLAADAKPVSAPVAAGAVGAQIGAFSSHDLADKGFADVGKLASTAGHGKRVEAVEHGGSTLYRTTVTGFADRDAAKAFCAQLAAKGHACIVKG